MNKKRVFKTMVLTLILVMTVTINVFAYTQEKIFGHNGKAVLDAESSGGLKRACAKTTRPSGESSMTLLESYCDDGTVNSKQDGPANRDTSASYDWEWSDGYDSYHKLINNGLGYASESFSY